ncbi:DUF4265 domain-containing protein [Xanthomonas sp. A1809]|uniref:DUF4265 domain-containing protein n=1 Tax=Xanthomonas TaxID=338 RepID=UPI001ADBA6B2|nr:DUF4265 domain-containing protein [Xanthomonas sp. A1809]MBO9857507.1 DUF4265 domain-containing protein [Xanthomonas sp. A1809]
MQFAEGRQDVNVRVRVHFQLEQDEDGYPHLAVESLWAEPSAKPNEYVIDNVPFFVRTATIGDTVRVREEDGNRWFDSLVHRSKNSLVRVVFFDRDCVDAVSERLVAMGCSTEYLREHNLMAVSIPFSVSLGDVQTYLQVEADAGRIDFEEPILRQG